MIGGLGDEVPRSKHFLVIKVPIQAVFVSFINQKIYHAVICITKCEKKFVHRLRGGAWPPVAPLDPPLCSPMFWWEPKLIVGAPLERVS